MRLDFSGTRFVLVWTEDQYRNEVARLMHAINTTAVKLVWTRKFLGLRFVVLRRVRGKPQAGSPGAVE